MRSLLRPVLKNILVFLTKKTLAKHNPRVIAVFGTGQTSIAREVTYHVLKEKFPVRRNLESPEAEFSVPLTIIGAMSYPKSYLSWLKFLLKTITSLLIQPKYKHILVLELNVANTDIFSNWLKIISPEVAYIIEQAPDFGREEITKIVKVANADAQDILGVFKLTVKEIGKYFGLTDAEMTAQLETFQLPKTKIRILPGKNNSTVIDASYYYVPTKLEAVLDLAQNGIIFTNDTEDIKKLDTSVWILNPKNYAPKEGDTIILRGRRVQINQKFDNLLDSKVPLL